MIGFELAGYGHRYLAKYRPEAIEKAYNLALERAIATAYPSPVRTRGFGYKPRDKVLEELDDILWETS